MGFLVELKYLLRKKYSGDTMNNEENQSKPIAEESQQSNKVPSKEAIEIAARIMANRAKRELELKQQ
jgi:hypothetical protein